MKLLTQTTLAICLIVAVNIAEAQNIRATDMDKNQWSKLYAGELQGITIEFREGDELPVTFTTEGDLFTSTRTPASYVGVKRNFWIKVNSKTVMMSLDGNNYKPFNDVVTGSFAAGTTPEESNSVANSIQLNLKMFLKH
ncbi:MAG: hypothetical protein ACXVCP_06860 [Bdellovibrio sp.]